LNAEAARFVPPPFKPMRPTRIEFVRGAGGCFAGSIPAASTFGQPSAGAGGDGDLGYG